MFRGQHRHTVDEKGRLSIPAKFRDLLGSAFEGPLYVTVLDGCLVAYPADQWRALEAKLDAKGTLDPSVKRFRRTVVAPANECSVDKAGRILLSSELRKKADIQREVILAGMGRTFEIWDAQRHEAMMDANLDDLDDILQGVGDIGI